MGYTGYSKGEKESTPTWDNTYQLKEAMYIHVNDPSLDRNLGKYQLPHIWDQVLQDTPALKLK